MRFSVITATFNCALCIEKTLASIPLQKRDNIEYLIIDNCSSDATVLKVKSLLPDSLVVSEPDTGIYNAFNKGLRLSSGDIISFLNAGDAYLPGALESVSAAFESYPEAEAVYGNIIVNGSEYRPLDGFRSIGGHRIYHPACFCRRSLFEKAAAFDESYKICADLDFFMRTMHNGNYVYIDKALTSFALGGVSTKYRGRAFREVLSIMFRHRINLFYIAAFAVSEGLRNLAGCIRDAARR